MTPDSISLRVLLLRLGGLSLDEIVIRVWIFGRIQTSSLPLLTNYNTKNSMGRGPRCKFYKLVVTQHSCLGSPPIFRRPSRSSLTPVSRTGQEENRDVP